MKNLILLIFLIFLAHYANANDLRKKLVVIDTGVSKTQVQKAFMCAKGVYSAVHDDGLDTHGHGENVIGLIASRIDQKKYCIVSVKAFYGKMGTQNYVGALIMADAFRNVAGINLSLSSIELPGSPINEELILFPKWIKAGKKVIVAAGNTKKTFGAKDCVVYPACMKLNLKDENFIVVESSTGKYSTHFTGFPTKKADGTNVGEPKHTGTSQATAIITGQEFSK